MKSLINGLGSGFGRAFGRIIAYIVIGYIFYLVLQYLDIDLSKFNIRSLFL